MIKIAKCNNRLWGRARQHTLKVAPREINKSYDDYECAVNIEDGRIVAYVFFWCLPPNMGAIHRFAFKSGREDAFLECVKAISKYLDDNDVREITTYVEASNIWELEIYHRMGFGMTTIRPMLRTRAWWKSEGLDKETNIKIDIEYTDLRELDGEEGLMSHNLIEEVI